MWMCFYSAHLFFTYSLVEKRGSWDKNAKAMNDEPTEKKIAVYFLLLSPLVYLELFKTRKAFASSYSFISFPRYDTFDGVLNRCCTNRKRIKKPPLFDRCVLLLMEQGDIRKAQWYLLFSNTFTWLMLPIALMLIFTSTRAPTPCTSSGNNSGKKEEKNPLKIYAQFKNL